MMDWVTDGQESIPWATSLLLTTQPCQLHNPHPSPALLHPLHHSWHPISSLLFHASLLCFSTYPHPLTLHHTPSHLSLNFSSLVPSLPQCPLAEAGSLPNWGLIPWIFLHVVTARAAIPLFLPPSLLCWVKASTQIPGLQPHAVTLVYTMLEHHIR